MINWENICKGCGECCGPIPFEQSFLLSNKHLYQEQPVGIDYIFAPLVVPMTKTLECVFLHKKTKRCMVYDNRPEVCRLQGTIPKLPCPKLQAIEGE